MLFPLIVLFTTVPVVELLLIIQIHGLAEGYLGQSQAMIFTITTIFLTGIAGAAIAKNQGFQILRKTQDSLSRGVVPGEALIEGVLVILGGILLLTPGYLSDIIGFALILPLSRPLIAKRLGAWLQEKLANGSIQVATDAHGFSSPSHPQPKKRRKPADVIDITAYQNLRKGTD